MKFFKSTAILFLLSIASAAMAHSPHDEIVLLGISPAYHVDRTLFITVEPTRDHWGRLLRSTDGGGNWVELGSGIENKSYLTAIAISPAFDVDRTLFLGSSGDGVFKSSDGGLSWVKLGKPADMDHIRLLVVSPDYLKDQVLVAGGASEGLFRSADGGHTWSQINENGKLTAVAFERREDGLNLVIGDADGNFLVSADDGLTWAPRGGPLKSAITAIHCLDDRLRGLTCLVGTQQEGFFRIGKGTPAWERCAGLPRNKEGVFEAVTSIAGQTQGDDSMKVYATTWSTALFVSDDGGRNWQVSGTGITKTPQADYYHEPHFSRVCVTGSPESEATLFLAGYDGLFKSGDAGENWRQLETLVTNHLEAFDLAPDFASSGKIAVATKNGGAAVLDGGRSWTIANEGMQTINLWDIAFSPAFATDQTVIAVSNRDIYQSSNGGSTWQKVFPDESRWARYVRSLLQMKKYGNIYPLDIAMSPDFENDRTFYLATRYRGVLQAGDGGATCAPIWDARGGWVSSLAISPAFRVDATLYAAVIINGSDSGVYKTDDRGRTWRLAGEEIHAVMAGNPDAEAKIAVSPDYAVDQTVFVGTVDGLFQSRDGGTSWHKPQGAAAVQNGYVRAVAFSPNYSEDGIVLVGVKGSGLFKSVNGGKSFFPAGGQPSAGEHQFYALRCSPNFAIDNTVFGAAEGELLQSTDGGMSWSILPRPVRYEDQNSVVRYEGEWRRKFDANSSGSTYTISRNHQDRVSLDFYGKGISIRTRSTLGPGNLAIYVDGEQKSLGDGFSIVHDGEADLYVIPELELANHSLKMVLSGGESGKGLAIDYFDVFPFAMNEIMMSEVNIQKGRSAGIQKSEFRIRKVVDVAAPPLNSDYRIIE